MSMIPGTITLEISEWSTLQERAMKAERELVRENMRRDEAEKSALRYEAWANEARVAKRKVERKWEAVEARHQRLREAAERVVEHTIEERFNTDGYCTGCAKRWHVNPEHRHTDECPWVDLDRALAEDKGADHE